MSTNVITPQPEEWDAFVEANGGHLLQTSRWGALKRAFGWRDEIIAVTGSSGKLAAGALVLTRQLPIKVGSVVYIPRGPVTNWVDADLTGKLLEAVDSAAAKHGAIMLKVEPDKLDTPQMRSTLSALGFRESTQTIQPPRSIMLDISGEPGDIETDTDPLLMQMSGTTRRKVRIGFRKGIAIREGDAAALSAFNDMMQVTGSRNAFGVHSPAYYEKAYELFVPGKAALLMASYEGQDVAGLFVFACGKTAWYVYGVSSNEQRNLMPTYALQWAAMDWARRRGCTRYDLWGIPDEDESTLEAQFKERSDGLWGVYGFKRGFGGEVQRWAGAWDRVYKPLLYRAYETAIAFRQFAG